MVIKKRRQKHRSGKQNYITKYESQVAKIYMSKYRTRTSQHKIAISLTCWQGHFCNGMHRNGVLEDLPQKNASQNGIPKLFLFLKSV
jgi:hypothetical protein